MSTTPTTANPFASLSLAQMIRLNLTRLYTWLIQMSASGQPHAPRDIAQMVIKTDALVQAFIRSRAMAQLEAAGYFDAARAMRQPLSMRTSPLEMPQLAVEPAEVEPASTEDLLSRVEAMIDQFERAETIASSLARIIVCALLYISPEAISAPFSIRLDAGRSARRIGAVSATNRREINRKGRVGVRLPMMFPVGQGPPGSTSVIPTGQVLRTRPPPLFKGRKACGTIVPAVSVQLSPLKRGRWRGIIATQPALAVARQI